MNHKVRRWYKTVVVMLIMNNTISYGQSFEGKVISKENKLPVYGVEVIDQDGITRSITDQNGNFYLHETGSFSFVKQGYVNHSQYIDNDEYIVVELEEVPFDLAEVVINSNQFQTELKKIPSSLSILPKARLKSNDGLNMAPLLNSVPGVYMHNGTLSTNRITIRGIGSRNLFGTSKIRSYYQDIPLTNGSGETTLEDIELEGIARVEVLKGPSSSLYGAGLGGSIQLIPDKGSFQSNSLHTTYTFGSFGLKKFLLGANIANRTNSAKINYSNTQRDGYRENNQLDRQTFTLATNHFLKEKDNLSVLVNLIDLKSYIPSSLNESDYDENPSKAAYTWGASRGFEDYFKVLVGLSWQHDYNQKSKQISSVFGSFLDSYEPRPFNILDQGAWGTGLRTRFVQQTDLFEKKLNWTVGIELFNDFNHLRTFENLYENFPPGTGSVKGDPLSDFEENRFYLNLFTEVNYQLSEKLLLNLGCNLNQTTYRLDDRFDLIEDGLSGNYSFDPVVSPKMGLIYEIDEKSMSFLSVSHGFSAPKLEETLLPDGLINNDIQPETGWNYELGSRGKLFNSMFNYEISLYLMDIDNLLVARRTGNDEFIGINAGKTMHKGLEISLNYFLINKEAIQLSHLNSFSLNDYEFKEFEDLDNDYSGNDLTGVPDKTFFSQLILDTSIGVYTFASYQYTGEIPVRDDNTIYSQSYQLFHLKTGYKKGFGAHFRIDAFIGLNNILDEKYASMLQINAGSFGTAAPRYYYPGEPRNYYAGLNLKYVF